MQDFKPFTTSSHPEANQVVEILHDNGEIQVAKFNLKYFSFNPKSYMKGYEWSLGTMLQESVKSWRPIV